MILIHQQPLHILDLMRHLSVVIFHYEQSCLEEPQVPMMLVILFQTDLQTFALDVRRRREKLWKVVTFWNLPDVVVEPRKVRIEDILVCLHKPAEMLISKTVFVNIQAVLSE